MAWGFRGDGAAAIVAGPGGMWFVPRGPANGRSGVARSDPGLQRWTVWDEFAVPGAPRGGMRTALVVGSTVWAGGEGGLFRFRPSSGGWEEVRGLLPAGSGAIYSLERDAQVGEGAIWVGTARGLHRLQGDGPLLGASLLPSETVLAIEAAPQGLWIGTAAGLFLLEVSDEGATGAIRPVEGPPAVSRPAGALAAKGDTIYAGLGDEVWSRSAGVGWHRVDAIGVLGGSVTSLAVRDGMVWAGSSEGVVVWDAPHAWTERASFAAGDLPVDRVGARGVWDILPTGPREAWLATPAGALRLQLRR